MAYILEIDNPFEPFNVKKSVVDQAITISEWVKKRFPKTGEFPVATICVVNGHPLKRDEWNYKIRSNDVINFVTLPQGELALIVIAIVVAVAAVAVALIMPVGAATTPGEQPESDPVFTTKGQTNSIRLGEPIEVNYGRNRVFPSLASRPYFEYRDNDQFQFSLFCIGQGEYQIDAIQIGDTSIDSFQEVEYELVPPASKVTLFPTNVYTAPEVGGQEMFAPNEDEYTGSGWVGPFSANQSGTTATELHVDLVFPKGFHRVLDSGKLEERTLRVQIQARLIDDLGSPLGSWFDLFVGKKTETYIATKKESSSSAESFVTWEWVLQSVIYSEVESGDPAEGTVTTTYSDGGGDDPTNRAGVTKTVETIILDSSDFPIGGKTTTPQRKTYRTQVTPGRYEVRVRRTDIKEISHRTGYDVIWEGLRTFIDTEQNYGNVTLLAVKIRATNNLNSQTQQRFNVICTRKLPIRSSGGFLTPPEATRSIVWAMVDVFRNVYGGQIDEDTFFDWDALEALDDLYTTRGEFFDWTFRDPITVWEAAKAVARVGRAIPLLSGSQITMKRDGPLTVPVTMFNQDNIIRGSFSWSVKLWDLVEHDSLQLEYTEPSTGYKQEQVIATLPGDTFDNPRDVRLAGVQDRTHAYRLGLYMLAMEKRIRDNFTFETGMEGYIPVYGDLISVSHDIPVWGQDGYVVHAVRSSPNEYQLWTSEPLVFTDGKTHQIKLRGSKGEVIGPLDAFQTTNSQQVCVKSESDIDFLLGGGNEPMLYLFGVSNNVAKDLRVVKIEPQGGERIRITAVPDDSTIYSYDSLDPAPLGEINAPPEAPGLPTVDQVDITQIDGPMQIVQVSWTAAFGAQYYVIQTSEDNEFWQERTVTTRTSIQFQARTGTLYVRVAAVNEGQGAWTTATIEVGSLNGITVNNQWNNTTSWGIRWWEVLNSRGYQVKVYDNSASSPVLKSTTQLGIGTRSFTYDYDDAQADSNVVREMMVEVDVLFENESSGGLEVSGSPIQQDLSNPIPSAPTSPSSAFLSEESDHVRYRLSWVVPTEDDLITLKVWLSAVSGFDPASTTPEVEETISTPGHAGIPTETEITIPLDSSGSHAVHYWRVAVFDVWGNEITTNITAEQTIPAYP